VRLESVDGQYEYGCDKQETEDDARKLFVTGMKMRRGSEQGPSADANKATCVEIMEFGQSSHCRCFCPFIFLWKAV
jgi:hypothetical protein